MIRRRKGISIERAHDEVESLKRTLEIRKIVEKEKVSWDKAELLYKQRRKLQEWF
jgi:hypothetical protein|tara:strand:+ start:705 stop:869 length:165 start_codon:yes stop_codon:yes gene_type:complete